MIVRVPNLRLPTSESRSRGQPNLDLPCIGPMSSTYLSVDVDLNCVDLESPSHWPTLPFQPLDGDEGHSTPLDHFPWVEDPFL